MGGDDKMLDVIFNMKFTSKQLAKSAAKAEKESEKEKKNIKKALEKGNTEAARIYAENSIRKRNEGNNLLRLASRVDAAASRVQTATQMKNVSKSMSSIVKNMGTVLETMDPLKIAMTMDKFEKQMEDMDVNVDTMDSACQNTSASMLPEEAVNSLLQEVADEHAIDISDQLPTETGAVKIGGKKEKEDDMDELTARLKALQVN
eukprot:gene11923-8204_t